MASVGALGFLTRKQRGATPVKKLILKNELNKSTGEPHIFSQVSPFLKGSFEGGLRQPASQMLT